MAGDAYPADYQSELIWCHLYQLVPSELSGLVGFSMKFNLFD